MIEAFWHTPVGHGIIVAAGVGLIAAAGCLLWGAVETVYDKWRECFRGSE